MAGNTESGKLICLDDEGKNYQTWRFQISVILKADGLFHVLTEDSKVEEKEDLKVQKLLVTTVGEKVLAHLISCNSAKDMWSRIRSLYAGMSENSLSHLQQKFYSYQYQNKGISFHIAVLENLAHEIKLCGEPISENFLINKILTSLPPQYKHFYSAWDRVVHKTKDNLVSRLLMEEEKLKSQFH